MSATQRAGSPEGLSARPSLFKAISEWWQGVFAHWWVRMLVLYGLTLLSAYLLTGSLLLVGIVIIIFVIDVTNQLYPFPPLIWTLMRLATLAIVDVYILMLAANIYDNGGWMLTAAMVLMVLVVNVVNFVPDLWPVRWIAPSLALIILLTVYPLIYTLYVAFTNYSDGHRLIKTEAVDLLERRRYLPAGAVNYYWTPYQDPAGNYALWLQSAEDPTEMYFAEQGKPLEPVTPYISGEGPYLEGRRQYPDGIPTTINGYTVLEGAAFFQAMQALDPASGTLKDLRFGNEENPIGISGRNQAGDFQQQWVFDKTSNTLTDKQTSTVYKANDKTGEFVAADGSRAPLGYWVPVGFKNFQSLFESSLKDGPLLRVFLWTVAFAFFSVLSAFAMGLFIALILNVNFIGVRVVRSVLLIPWAIPGMIGILIWRGMLNGQFGIIPTTLDDIFGWAPPFFTHPFWAKFAILLVNLWFAYPYFMLISSGALQSIPESIYEAAEVDGASPWNKFWSLTLPLLLVAVGPLLIASFVFNFNNYLLIEALTEGGPQMKGTNVPPVGHTDNLITYTYRYAFSSGGRADFGFASAIAVVIFFIIGLLTILQFRLTRRWEEVSENV